MKRYLYLSFGLWMILSLPALACITPVFRYALENWPADLYEVTVIHNGPLSAQEQALLKRLKDVSDKDAANLLVESVDIAGKSKDEVAKLWGSRPSSDLPWMVVRYPQFTGIKEPMWEDRFTKAAVGKVLNSPLRSKIVKRILDGDTAFWVLVKSGVKEKDEAAARLLKEELKRMERELDFSPEYREYMAEVIGAELKVKFSLIRLPRGNREEQLLIQTLLRPIPNVEKIRQPIAFPIFGRGRALCALVGDEINEENVEEICYFLVGGCSCQVKGANPGWDLLLSADWDGMLEGQMEEAVFAGPATVVKGGGAGLPWRNILIALSSLFVLVAGTTYVILWRRRRYES